MTAADITSCRFRTASIEDAPALAALGRETFGHLYRPDDLAAFLVSHDEERWREQLAADDFAVRIAEAGGKAVAYAKLGPPSLPFEVSAPSIELRQFYVLRPWQGTSIARELMDWVLAEARRRGGAARRSSICRYSSTIGARAASTSATASPSSRLMPSWSATTPTRTTSCA